MKSRVKVVGIGSCVLVLVLSGVGIAAASGGPSHPQPPPQSPSPQSARIALVATPGSESRFVPITPCRIANTLHGGGIIGGAATRTFQVTGTTGFLPQGGTGGGCGIPASARSVSLSITATGEAGTGYVTVYPNGAARPVTAVLAFTHNVTITGNADATIGTNGQVRAFVGGSATHLVLDVGGYFIGPMWAEVSSAGSLVQGSRAVSVTHIGTGAYQVDFDRDITGCGYVSTSYFFGITTEVEPRSGDANAVFVGGADYNGTGVDTYFYVTVTC